MRINNIYIENALCNIKLLADEHMYVQEWIDILKKEGYMINQYASEILYEIGGLHFKGKSISSGIVLELNFNPIYYASGEIDRMQIYNTCSQDILFPIGGMYDYTIYIGVKGEVYIADWKNLYKCGDDFEKFINNVCANNPQLIELYNGK